MVTLRAAVNSRKSTPCAMCKFYGRQARLLSLPPGGRQGTRARGAAVRRMGTRMNPGPWDERGWEEGGREANTRLLAWDPHN